MDHFKVRAMKAYVNIGASQEFRLCEALLVYRGGGDGAFASLHQVKQGENGIPYLAPGEALTTALLRTLAQGLGAQVKPEILPENVLARLFRYGTLCYHGGFISLSTGVSSRLQIDASMWRRLRRRCKSELSRA
jgi:hypothetical protein